MASLSRQFVSRFTPLACQSIRRPHVFGTQCLALQGTRSFTQQSLPLRQSTTVAEQSTTESNYEPKAFTYLRDALRVLFAVGAGYSFYSFGIDCFEFAVNFQPEEFQHVDGHIIYNDLKNEGPFLFGYTTKDGVYHSSKRIVPDNHITTEIIDKYRDMSPNTPLTAIYSRKAPDYAFLELSPYEESDRVVHAFLFMGSIAGMILTWRFYRFSGRLTWQRLRSLGQRALGKK